MLCPYVILRAKPEGSRNRTMTEYCVYILTNSRHTVLYTGVTNDLRRRVAQHRSGVIPGFTHRYRVTKLVYFETTDDVWAAIEREKAIKGWRRDRKDQLVAAMNPSWNELLP